MQFSLYINQVKALEWALNAQQAILFAFIYELSSWADAIDVDGVTYYRISKAKIIRELPLLTDKPDTAYRLLKQLAAADLIALSKANDEMVVALTDRGRTWNKSDLPLSSALPGEARPRAMAGPSSPVSPGRARTRKTVGPSLPPAGEYRTSESGPSSPAPALDRPRTHEAEPLLSPAADKPLLDEDLTLSAAPSDVDNIGVSVENPVHNPRKKIRASEKNPSYLGKKSEPPSENFPTYQITNNQITRSDNQGGPPPVDNGIAPLADQIAADRELRYREKFTLLCKAYPKDPLGDGAWVAFCELEPDNAMLDWMLRAIADQRVRLQWHRESGRYVPSLERWLRQRRWMRSPGARVDQDSGAAGAGGSEKNPAPVREPVDPAVVEQRSRQMRQALRGERA